MVPKRGEKRGLLDLAARNAEVAYQARFNENVAANYDALETLRAVLALPASPRRIECFDISTIQGSETVASMVVCEDGRMKKSEYRKFRSGPCNRTVRADGQLLSVLAGPHPRSPARLGSKTRSAVRPQALARDFLDDFAAMHEVVLRRYRRAARGRRSVSRI